jgi:hypothetical protein
VGIAFVIGFAFVSHYVKQTVKLSFREVLAVPLAAAIAALIVYVLIASTAAVQELPPVLIILVKSGAAVGAFYTVILILRPSLLFERAGYVWRLFRVKNQ